LPAEPKTVDVPPRADKRARVAIERFVLLPQRRTSAAFGSFGLPRAAQVRQARRLSMPL